MIKRKQKRHGSPKSGWKREDITTALAEYRRIIREYHEQIYDNKLDSLDEMYKKDTDSEKK